MFGSNIQLLRKRKKLSQEELASEIGIKRSALSSYEVGTAEPGFEVLLKLSDFFNVPVDILLKSDLSTYPEEKLARLQQEGNFDITGRQLRVLATTVDNSDNENIELVPVNAKAGYVNGHSDPDYIRVLPTFTMPFLSSQKKYRTFPISGDSMPPVPDGSWVTGEYVQNWNTLKPGQPYIIITLEEGIVFKIIHEYNKEHHILTLASTNPVYDPYDVHLKDVKEIWKFVNFISSELPEPNLSRDELTSAVLNIQRDVSQIKNVLRNKPTSEA